MRTFALVVLGTSLFCGACSAAPADDVASAPSDLSATTPLENAGPGVYKVTSVSGDSSWCFDTPSMSFGDVGDILDVNFTSAGVVLADRADAFEVAFLQAGTHTESGLGAVDKTTGTYTTNAFSYEDHQSPTASENMGLPYLEVGIARSGATLTIASVLADRSGNVLCTLTRVN
jgi:hypothetical protein